MKTTIRTVTKNSRELRIHSPVLEKRQKMVPMTNLYESLAEEVFFAANETIVEQKIEEKAN